MQMWNKQWSGFSLLYYNNQEVGVITLITSTRHLGQLQGRAAPVWTRTSLQPKSACVAERGGGCVNFSTDSRAEGCCRCWRKSLRKEEQGHSFVFTVGQSINFISIAQQEAQRDTTAQKHYYKSSKKKGKISPSHPPTHAHPHVKWLTGWEKDHPKDPSAPRRKPRPWGSGSRRSPEDRRHTRTNPHLLMRKKQWTEMSKRNQDNKKKTKQ